MELQQDSQGFLVGQRIDVAEIKAQLDGIHDELKAIRATLEASMPRPAVVATPLDQQGAGAAAPPVEAPGSSFGASADSAPGAGSVAVPTSAQVSGAPAVQPATPSSGQDSPSRSTAAQPAGRPQAGDNGRLAEGRHSAGRPAAARDASGRFVGSTSGAEGDAERAPGAIASMGERIVNALRETGEGAEEADPAVKAFNEIAQPLSRGFGLIFGGGEDRKQDRWYRRFWREMREKRREDQAAQRQNQRTLRGIERNGSGGEGGGGFLGLIGLLAPMLAPLFALLGGIAAAVKGLASLTGITRLIAALSAAVAGLKALVPRSVRSFFGGERQAHPTRAGPSQASHAAGSTAGRAGYPRESTRPGAPVAAPAGHVPGGRFGGALGGLTRRLPFVGALAVSLGAAVEALGVLRSDASREEKSKAVGRAGGGVAGSLGGMWAGAKMGAALGALGGPIGAAIGSVVGGAAGAFFGDQAGQLVGEKVGGWVEELRSSNLTQTITDAWYFTTDFAGALWGQMSAGIGERWAAISETVSGLWSQAAANVEALWGGAVALAGAAWESVTATWSTAVEGMKKGWDSAVELVSKGWEALKGIAGKAADAVKEATGIDLEKTYNDAKEAAGGLVDGARAAVTSTWNTVGEAASSAAASVKSGARAVADATGVTTAVRAGRNAYRHAEGKGVMRSAMAEAGITDPNEQAAFMAQMDHESAGFTQLEESLNYKPENFLAMYGKRAGISTVEEAQAILSRGPEATAEAMYGGAWGRKNLGNVEQGDAARFTGRGYVQLTGRSNYEAAGKALGIDLVGNPELAKDPATAAKIATWYWQSRSGLSEAAKRGDVSAVTKRINGGTNGLADRQAKAEQYLAEARAGDLTVPPGATPSLAALQPAAAVASASEPAAAPAGLAQVIAPPAATASPVISPAPATIPAVRAPAAQVIAEAPRSDVPLATGGGRQAPAGAAAQDVPRDLPDRRIAHIVTGAYSGMG